MGHRLNVIAAICALTAFASACASPPSRFYTLNAITAPAATAFQPVDSCRPGIGASGRRPTLRLSSPWARIRFGRRNLIAGHRLCRTIFPESSPKTSSRFLGTPRVILFSQTLGGDVDYRAAIEVQRF